jgi:glycosyltransferase involved in cell wall biosynthesis
VSPLVRDQRCRVDSPAILFVTHNLGGGVEKHINELNEIISDSATVLVLTPTAARNLYYISVRTGSCNHEFYFHRQHDWQKLLEILCRCEISRIHYHHLLGLDERVWSLGKYLNIPYDVTLHDYFLVCPQIHLSKRFHRYCGEAGEEQCISCLESGSPVGNVDIHSWRKQSAEFLLQAERIFAPSKDTAERFLRYFPNINPIITEHPDVLCIDKNRPVVPRTLGSNENLRIVCIGLTSRLKGLELVNACGVLARHHGMPLEFHVLGKPYGRIVREPQSALRVHGFYNDSELKDFLENIQPHIAWFPSLCPETYSYALSGALSAGLPVVCSDLGSFPERVSDREWSWIVPWESSPQDMIEFFIQLRKVNFLTGSPPALYQIDEGIRTYSVFRYDEHYLLPRKRKKSQSSDSNFRLNDSDYKYTRPSLAYRISRLILFLRFLLVSIAHRF